MQINKLTIEPPIVLAPMAGITDQPFRRLAKEKGCGLLVSEMVSAKGLLYSNKNTLALMRFEQAERPFAVQLFGRDPEEMALAAKRAADLSPDIIDVNMGCPAAKVVKNGEGAALLREPALVYEIVARMADSVNIPVTVKIRSGWDEHAVNAPEIAFLAEKAGALAITVHARTRSQFYAGAADWQVIKATVGAVGIPVIGNGDIKAAADAKRMFAETGCAAVMIGRAAAGNPWLFAEIAACLRGDPLPPPPGAPEKFALMARHLELLIEHKGETVALKEMRRHAGDYIKGLPFAAECRKLFGQVCTRREFCRALRAYEGRLLRRGACAGGAEIEKAAGENNLLVDN
ncbi:MAG: tRNA dihydrouridine synthase DusB [Acidaminococcales bacterium]|jgi:tRNA-dihydrouridine synthase B|nr:tRNA dihydrouridine synthase DusB [Acidaminococcales bacterium]